jgi:hypothetical protein
MVVKIGNLEQVDVPLKMCLCVVNSALMGICIRRQQLTCLSQDVLFFFFIINNYFQYFLRSRYEYSPLPISLLTFDLISELVPCVCQITND